MIYPSGDEGFFHKSVQSYKVEREKGKGNGVRKPEYGEWKSQNRSGQNFAIIFIGEKFLNNISLALSAINCLNSWSK